MKYRNYYILAVALAGIALLVVMPGRRRIITFAKTLVGQEELAGNIGFKSRKLQELMEEVGWKRGDQWCVYFAKMIWYNMAPERLKPLVLKLVSGNSQQAYKNILEDKTGAFIVSKYPRRGDMVIWQYYDNGSPTWKGHAGIVQDVKSDVFDTIEGNTNVAGSRTGFIVAEKERGYDFTRQNGLRLKGFLRMA